MWPTAEHIQCSDVIFSGGNVSCKLYTCLESRTTVDGVRSGVYGPGLEEDMEGSGAREKNNWKRT